VRTCAGYEGSYQHEIQDAMTYAEWGVDFLKYDLCSYTNSDTWKNSKRTIEDQIKPVAIMQEALDNCDRDIVHNFGGWPEVWEWGPEIGLNQWRISRDITPVWNEVKRVMLTQRGAEAYARPGHWNDPDYLMVGNSWFSYNYPSALTGNEQLFQVTHWSLSAAPLFVSCNMATLDEFTLALLSNHEVIDVDQDPLGIQAKTVYQTGDADVLARPLHDGTKAVGLFNWGEHPTKITIHWEDLRMKGPQPVRDLWQRKDLGIMKESFTTTVGRHGAVFIKVGKPKPSKF
jgi:alpha-galactosidase